MRKLIYLYPSRYTFVAKDIDALSDRFSVLEHRFDRGGKWMLPWAFAVQLVWLLKARQGGAREVISHFAGYHAMLPILLGFRTHVIVAGSDACSFPKINYGNFRKLFLSRCIGYVMRNACTILPVHESLAAFQNTYSDLGPVEQGFTRFAARLNTPARAIPYGFDAEFWQDPEYPEKEREGVICVAAGAAFEDPVYFRKGLDLVLDVAKSLPHITFTIVGVQKPEKYPSAPNIRVLGRLSAEALKDLLSRSSIYCQASVMEGFPNALCEAMLMGTVPIVSDVTSMPEIVQDLGMILSKRSHEELGTIIQGLHSLPGDELQGRRASGRKRIMERYPMSLRQDRLEALLR